MWQTRTICTFVAATVPVEEKGADNPLLEEAMRIGETETGGQQQPRANVGVRTETDEYGRSREVADVNPRDATFEAFMGSFGDPTRWAGRG